MEIKKSSVTVCLLCYVIWGSLAAYWNLLLGVNSMLILSARVVFAFVFTFGPLLIAGRLHVFIDIIKDKATMLYLAPASVLIIFNWGIYIWAVNSGRILDASLAYYMNPLINFVFATLVFREKATRLQIAAIALAFTGVLISVIAYGSFPYVSLILALSFAGYGVIKKKAHYDPVAGVAVESLLLTPFALAFCLLFMADNIKAVSGAEALLLIGGGLVTVIPLVLYSLAVNETPYIIVGFFQYISPSIQMIYGLVRGETLSEARLFSFVFIGLGLIVFSIAVVINHKKSKALSSKPSA